MSKKLLFELYELHVVLIKYSSLKIYKPDKGSHIFLILKNILFFVNYFK